MSHRIETERLILRPPSEADGPAYVDFYRSERAEYVGGPLSLRKAWYAFYSEFGHWQLRGYGSFVVTSKGDDAALGVIGPFYPHTWPEPEIGYVLFPEAEGKGIAFEAAMASRDFAYRTLGWTTAVSYIDVRNARSIALAERMGAVPDPHAVPLDDDDIVYRHPGPEVLS